MCVCVCVCVCFHNVYRSLDSLDCFCLIHLKNDLLPESSHQDTRSCASSRSAYYNRGDVCRFAIAQTVTDRVKLVRIKPPLKSSRERYYEAIKKIPIHEFCQFWVRLAFE
uniref:Uncharacterized protein n=1 Tax=Cacopsylla melanoneura TaxID=428564 RepID=A0A8D8XAK9_9HEMI